MKLIRHWHDIQPSDFPQGCVATIGNFDGLHRGHQAIFELLKKHDPLLPQVVITFEPLPKEYFSRETSKDTVSRLSRLTRFKEKFKYLNNTGIHAMICLHFNAALAHWDAHRFVNEFLVNRLNIKHLIVGHDFQFGKQRQGNLIFLKQKALEKQFTVITAPEVHFEGERVSSTRIREALNADNLLLAKHLLGRWYSIQGKVIHGDKRARLWGIPTANLSVHRSILPTVLPVRGVYVVQVAGIARTTGPVFGVANVGKRPSVNGFRHLLEVHLLNYEGDLYDQTIDVQFLHKLREEKRFDSLELLKEQILSDVKIAKAYFTEYFHD